MSAHEPGTGTDVAMSSAPIALVKAICAESRTHAISAATVANMKQNLGFAFVYNAFGVPLAAGLLYPFTGWLLCPAQVERAPPVMAIRIDGGVLVNRLGTPRAERSPASTLRSPA